MTIIKEYQSVLYQHDTRLLIHNKTLRTPMDILSWLSFTVAVIMYIHTGITRFMTGLHSLRENVKSSIWISESIASHLGNPLISPLDELRSIPVLLNQDMKADPNLKLPEDSDMNIWAYYYVRRILSTPSDDFLSFILTILLIDKSTQVNIYKVHNLPVLHLELKLQFM